jgi:hypothetical protein
MSDTVFLRNAALRAQLNSLLRGSAEPVDHAGAGASTAPSYGKLIDVVVTQNEINDTHGTGALVKRILSGRRNIFSIRSRDDWGAHDFGDWSARISQQGRTRPACFRNVLRLLGGRQVRNVICVPFLIDEVMTSIAIRAAFDARLCVYLMDDQNVVDEIIPDAVMRELLEKASLRLATHPELRLAYERKYGLPFYILPAVAPAHLVATEPLAPPERLPRRVALLGSFWDRAWFDRLCSVLAGCRCAVDWFGNNRSPQFSFPPEDLARAGITAHGVIPEERLTLELRKYPFAIVPVGTLEEEGSIRGVVSLSLPGRILFAVATSHTPILVVGSENTCGARFVKHFGVGATAPYETSAVASAMDRLNTPDVQVEMRRNAARIARKFSDDGVVNWLTASIERGAPADGRFEEAFSEYPAFKAI